MSCVRKKAGHDMSPNMPAERPRRDTLDWAILTRVRWPPGRAVLVSGYKTGLRPRLSGPCVAWSSIIINYFGFSRYSIYLNIHYIKIHDIIYI